ncbi:MAG TPA: heme ABC exporter ATP-binding protein CcmA [Thermoanaerobaculia bacterium]|jgi:heme exporter protein A
MSGASIEAERVSRRYGRRWALAEVSFRIEGGTVLIVAGPNGSGKSTLLRVLATAIRPDGGTLRVGGFDARTHREDVRRMSAILGHASYLYEALTARENLEVFAAHMPGGAANVESLLARVGLAERASDAVATFSAGMRKRLSFARVLLQQPQLALFDEPYGQLDPPGFLLVDDLVRELKAAGSTVVMATHQVDRGRGLGDVVLSLEAGRVRELARC